MTSKVKPELPDETQPERAYRKRELSQFVGLKKTQIDALIKSGKFPPGVPVSDDGRTVVWFASDVLRWQDERRMKVRSAET
jgi:predicted DNA-binding transcriptional regulator AlpA